MKKGHVAIIGAGPCGLGAGWRLKELKQNNFHIYEQSDHVGGLACSFIDEKGFTWDVGGHVLHSHYSYFDRMFGEVMGADYFTHKRESWIYIYDRFVPYPFQNNLRYLPAKVVTECLRGLEKAKPKKYKNIKNFADWILVSFGQGIANHFLFPYNQKVWAYPLKQMNYQWVGDRVAQVDIARIKKNILEKRDDVSWGPNYVFRYPKHGGTGEIWKRVAKRFKNQISLDKQVVKIDVQKKRIFFADRGSVQYDQLLSTIPLDKLANKVDGVDLPNPRGALHYSTVTVVGIGIEGTIPEHLRTKSWIYFPENLVPFFRATIFSNYSKFNAPQGTWSLMTEVASSRYRKLPPKKVSESVIKGAKKVKLIKKDDRIVDIWQHEVKRGYPTPTLARDSFIDKILPILESYDMYSRGRFGAWKYEVSNQDHTFMQGVEWVNRLFLGQKEATLRFDQHR